MSKPKRCGDISLSALLASTTGLDIQPVRRIRSGSLVAPGKRTICSRIEVFWSQDCIWTWLIRPDAPLLLRCIRAKYLSLAQIPHGFGVMATNRDKPTKIPPSRSPGPGSSELIDQQQSITPTNQGLLSGLPENLFTSLFSRATTVRLKTNEVLFLAGDTGDGCYRVEDEGHDGVARR
jgi:hypothetical protein